MFNRVFNLLSRKDDLEIIASKANWKLLAEQLKTRKILVPKRPLRMIDPQNISSEDLITCIQKDAEDLNTSQFSPWIFENNSKKMIPIFSSQDRFIEFSKALSLSLNKVFGLGYMDFLLQDVLNNCEVDLIILNFQCKNSWEISPSILTL